ncbi:MAG: hypothetical protein FD180_4719 [Planctomycetota bacterium]|nr:MAG: hypothetical protein FD180_4719 [Planctomycetota bacterium]
MSSQHFTSITEVRRNYGGRGALLPAYSFAAFSIDSLRDRHDPHRAFCAEVRRRIPADAFVSYGADDSRIKWYLGAMPNVESPQALHTLLSGQPDRRSLVVADARIEEKILQSPLLEAVAIVRTPEPDLPFRHRKPGYTLFEVRAR